MLQDPATDERTNAYAPKGHDRRASADPSKRRTIFQAAVVAEELASLYCVDHEDIDPPHDRLAQFTVGSRVEND